MSATPRVARPDAATSRRMERREHFLSPRVVAREAAKVLAAAGIEVRPATLRTLVTRFIESGHTTTEDLRTYLLAYADPTGEQAVRNVMRVRHG